MEMDVLKNEIINQVSVPLKETCVGIIYVTLNFFDMIQRESTIPVIQILTPNFTFTCFLKYSSSSAFQDSLFTNLQNLQI